MGNIEPGDPSSGLKLDRNSRKGCGKEEIYHHFLPPAIPLVPPFDCSKKVKSEVNKLSWIHLHHPPFVRFSCLY